MELLGWFRLYRENLKIRMRKMVMVNKEFECSVTETNLWFQHGGCLSL